MIVRPFGAMALIHAKTLAVLLTVVFVPSV